MGRDEMRIRVSENESGVSLWIDGRWIVDASQFNEDKTLTIAMNRLRETENCDKYGNITYEYVGDEMDRRLCYQKENKRLWEALETIHNNSATLSRIKINDIACKALGKKHMEEEHG